MTHQASPGGRGSARFELYPLTFVDDGDQVIIGRPDIDSFAIFSADAAAVLRRLRIGADPSVVATWYQATYGETVDINDFLDLLRDLGFIRSDEEDPAEILTQPPVRLQRLGAAVFSAPALTLYALFVGLTVYLMVRVPALRPVPSKVFFNNSLLVVMAVISAGQVAGLAWHEWFHVLAGRRLGLASRISLGRRLYFLVIQTTLVGLMGVRSRKRILPFCAGLIADALLISVLTGLAEVGRLAGWPSWAGRAAVAIAYVTILRMIWQAMIFMETDLYQVLAAALRCPDLHQMTRSYLRGQVARLSGRSQQVTDESGWTDRDRRIVLRYAPFVVVFSVAMICLAAGGGIPVLAGLAARVYDGVSAGRMAAPQFWDSLITALAILSQFAAVAVISVRDRRRRLSARDST